MKNVVMKLSDLKRPERNVRMHSQKQLAEFRRSVEMFGQIRPIVVDEAGTILAGNGLYETLLNMGWTEAECYVVSGLSENEKKKLMLVDNRIYSLGVDDMDAFDAIIAELGTDLEIPGYDDELLSSLVADAGEIDDLISGYGLVDDSTKNSMARASNQYEKEDEAFTEHAEEYHPSAKSQDTVSSDRQQAETSEPMSDYTREERLTAPLETPLQRRYLLCPKCGEKIWL